MARTYKRTSSGEYDLSGYKFGRWTVLDKVITDKERKWLCRCDCGTERYVMERSLIYDASHSCGCLTRERAAKKNAHDLKGTKFGDLTVLRKLDKKNKAGSFLWLCRCSCGKELEVPGTLLYCGRKTSCGCKAEHHYASSDIAGKKFNRLTALYPTEKRSSRGSVVWHCKCECGNEVDVSYNSLMYGNLMSCGCQKKEHDEKLQDLLAFVDGTSVDLLRSKKIRKNNTTGVKGVYFIRNKYVAKIVFQHKAYYLGTYDNKDDAAAARKCAEETICDTAVEFYDKWKAIADKDPQWAKENPIKFMVSKINDNLQIQMLPDLN